MNPAHPDAAQPRPVPGAQRGYRGETINPQAVVAEVEQAARAHGWEIEQFHAAADLRWLALHRPPRTRPSVRPPIRVYLSAGIHGDEPAGPLAVEQLISNDAWPCAAELWVVPCLNPTGFQLNRRENAAGADLNRDYRHLETAEVRAHVAWLARQPAFDVTICLHEDWEVRGFYLYELNPENRPSLAPRIIAAVAAICPIEHAQVIEGRPAAGGIIRPSLDPHNRPRWSEAFYLLQTKTRLSYTLEAPSNLQLDVRVTALMRGVAAGLDALAP